MKFDNTNKKLREFGILIGVTFPLFIGWIIPILGGHSFRAWTLFVGLPALLLGLIRPSLLKLPYRIWMKIGYILGWINSRLILGIVFILILQPIALLMKIRGYDPLKIKKSYLKTYKEKRKYFIVDLEKIF